MKRGGLIIAAVTIAAYFQVPIGCLAGEQVGDAPAADAKPTATASNGVSGGDEPAAPGTEAPTSQSAAPEKTLRKKVRALITKLAPERLKRDVEFKKASEQFQDFCRHWEQNLRERERDNLSKLTFTLKDGFQTATYTGYGDVKTCEAHQSKEGFSIGKITYQEFTYYLAGKTPEEALHGEKKPISDIHTTEIFRWENNKWFY
jgi:hypothetical protein